jgi:hypothetical protein
MRQALYDSLGLVGGARTVPQIFLEDADGEIYRIGGAQELKISGIESLFQEARPISAPVAVASALTEEQPANMVAAEEGHSCCE